MTTTESLFWIITFIRVLFGLFSVGVFVWSCIILKENTEYKGDCGDLWPFLLYHTILSGLSIVSTIQSFCYKSNNEETSFLENLVMLGGVGSLIWIFILWEHEITGTCKDFYKENANDMYFLFVFLFWYAVAILSMMGAIITGACGYYCCYNRKSDMTEVMSRFNNHV